MPVITIHRNNKWRWKLAIFLRSQPVLMVRKAFVHFWKNANRFFQGNNFFKFVGSPMKEYLNFSGKTVIVTGGGKGVGLGISKCFLEFGANVIICGRGEPE